MLPRSQQVEQDIVLRTDTHKTAHVVQILLENIIAVDRCVTRTRPQHARQHGDGSCLTCAIVAKQRKDLSFIHSDVDAIDGTKAIAESFSQILNLQEPVLSFEVLLRHVGRFKVFWVDILGFEIIVNLHLFVFKNELLRRKCTFSRFERVLLVLLAHLNNTLAVTASAQIEAVPVGRREPVTRVEPVALGACITRHNIVNVDAKEGVDYEVQKKHLDAIHEDVVVVL